MNPQVSAITLGVEDIDRSKEFYEKGLGFRVVHEAEGFVALGAIGASTSVGLYTRDALAADAGVEADGTGFRGAMTSLIFEEAAAVDALIESAQKAGGSVIKPAKSQLWGGYTGHVTDPDGHVWKIGSNHRPPLFRGGKRQGAAPLPTRPSPEETAVTLGCRDIKQSKAFYADGLGFLVDKSFGKFCSFKAEEGATALSLYTWEALADDAGVDPQGQGFRAMTLSYVASSSDEVDEVMSAAAKAGASVTEPAKAAWGYSGYFTDPSGHIWKVASGK
ncbi:MAG: VOC family protein [Acidimicrobiia bacterium]|nr:VOC family protein [Acidimicrobiia bacterium]